MNPIVNMTLLGIIGNFAFNKNLPGMSLFSLFNYFEFKKIMNGIKNKDIFDIFIL